MADILDNELNLRILKLICAGKGVSVNYSYLAKRLKRHRDTIRKRVDGLFQHKIIEQPVYPFFGQFKVHPLMVMVQADIPLTKDVEKWLATDDHIFAAYKRRKGEYNLLLLLFHRSILRYQLWRQSLVREKKIPPRTTRYPSSASFFSTQMMIKYEPSAAISILKKVLNERGKVVLNKYKIGKLGIDIMDNLTKGEGVRINEDYLAKKLKVNRKTIRARISKLLKEHMILKPVCRFPAFFCPPDSVLAITLLEVKKNEKELVSYFKGCPHISLAFQICSERYNYLLFEVFENVEDHMMWGNRLVSRFPECLGASEVVYVTPNMMVNMNQQKVSIEVIKKKLDMLKNPVKEEAWSPLLGHV